MDTRYTYCKSCLLGVANVLTSISIGKELFSPFRMPQTLMKNIGKPRASIKTTAFNETDETGHQRQEKRRNSNDYGLILIDYNYYDWYEPASD